MIKINLLPAETKVQIPKAYKHIALALVVFVISLGGIGAVWAQTQELYNSKKEEAAKKEKTAKDLDAVIAEVARFKKTKADLQEKLDTIDELKDSQKGPLRLLTELRDRFPKQVWVSKVTYKKNLVTLTGFAATLTTVGELVENCKASNYFKDINYERSVGVTTNGVKIYNFVVKMAFDADPEKTAARDQAKAKAKAEAEAAKKREAAAKAEAKKKPKT